MRGYLCRVNQSGFRDAHLKASFHVSISPIPRLCLVNMKSKRLMCSAALGLLLASVVPVVATPGTARRPNVIVVVTDDHGWADLACQWNRPEVATPNLDALAASGIRFSRGYVSAPVCIPSRAGI